MSSIKYSQVKTAVVQALAKNEKQSKLEILKDIQAELRIRQKALDPAKFSDQKVKIL